MTVLVLDNLDSFTYNLVDFFRQLGCPVKVFRNTADPERIAQEDFDLLVLSPGPSVPRNAGNLMRVIERFYREKPILGVCLGHQALIEFFGGTLANIAPVHGKSVPVQHDSRGVFTGLAQDCRVARYHSWAGDLIPPELEVSARSHDGTVMAVRHKRLPIEGIQFHPESVLSMKDQVGMQMLRNVVAGRLASGNRIYHDLNQKLQTGTSLDTNTLRTFLQAVEEGQLSEDQKQILLVSLSHSLRRPEALHAFIEVLMELSSNGKGQLARDEGQMANGKGQIANPQSQVVSPKSQVPNPQSLIPNPQSPIPNPQSLIPNPQSLIPIDICGTGGSGLPRINTSTLVSLLLGHCGLKIAKHGNKAAAGRFGSFNLLESLGVPIRFDPERATRTLEETNLAFVFAPDVHPVFRHFASVRARIGVPTVFNVLGPLVNPYLPERQFIGTAFADLMEVIFETAIRMGKRHVIVVRGHEGLDEISASGPTRVLEYRDGQRLDYDISPADFGLAPLPFSAVSAASPDECLGIARAMIEGRPAGAHHELVAINAAFIYSRFVEDIPLPVAYEKMRGLIFEGAMREVLEQYVSCMKQEMHYA